MDRIVPHRELGRTGLELPSIALGSWHIYDRMDFADAVAMLRYALHRGVTMFDIGVYGAPGSTPTHTDVLWGSIMRAIGVPRKDYLVSAKLWIEGFGEHGFRPQLENLFLRTGIEHADLVVLGDLRRTDVSLEELLTDLDGLRRAGLIHVWGVNNWSADAIGALQRIAADRDLEPPRFAQLKYSAARRSIPDGKPFAELFGPGFALEASDVFEGGILAGNTEPGRAIGRDPGGIRETIRGCLPRFTSLAAELGATPAQLCVAFSLTHPATTTTLLGASSLTQLRDDLGAFALLDRIGATELRALVEPFWADRGIVDPEGP
ncbi:aldo/keto reductase [Sciscionella marina]|uniref:aldo/keto reductase n=1 Tax=Sciscionella marina TaxID=508770 RepID=UPI000376A263|nr:aldo/keto reductase [Sciscionella marina]